jgi:DNA-binding NarL/FixJ family response regulator
VIRVLLADDQSLVRRGFRMILELEDDVTVCGEAGDGDEAVSLTRDLRPDVVLMDIKMPVQDGLTATRRLMDDPTCTSRVLVLTTFDDDDKVFRALRHGASGFLLKDVEPEDLVHAVRSVARGDAFLGATVTRRMIGRFIQRDGSRRAGSARLAHLTEREREVFGLVARGLSNQEIASALFLSPATVKTHVQRVLAKLGLRDRVQAVILAYESGLVEPGANGPV